MKTITYVIGSLLYLFLSSCGGGENIPAEDNEPEIRITKCFEPVSSHIEYDVSGLEYEAPDFLTQYLDSIIRFEKGSICYNERTGFRIAFSSVNDTFGKILISPLPNVGVGDYKRSKGFIYYDSHYFVCDGDIEKFPIDTICNVTIKLFEPVPTNAQIDDSRSSWRFSFNFNTKKLTLDSRVGCMN